MSKEQFEAIINKVDFLKDDNGNIDYDIIVTILGNHFNECGSARNLNQLIDAECEVLKHWKGVCKWNF